MIGAINGQDDYQKTRNYWKYLKAKLKRGNNQLVSATTQLKFRVADGKRYNADSLDAEEVKRLAKEIPNEKAMTFLDWFTYTGLTSSSRSVWDCVWIGAKLTSATTSML